MQYLIGSWYRRDELAKRSCIFHTAGSLASMFSGYLMAAVYNLEGKGGFRGWQVSSGISRNRVRCNGLTCDTVALYRGWRYFATSGSPRLHLSPRHA